MLRALVGIAITLCACRPQAAAEPAPVVTAPPPRASVRLKEIPASEGPQCDGVDLDIVAACVRQAIAIVQHESDAYGSLLAEANETGRLDPICAALPGVGSGPLRTASGEAIAIESGSSSWDHMDDGSARRFLDYRVGCECCSETATFTVEHSVGER